MSVFKRKRASTFEYDFQLRGRRFTGTTRKKSKREAEQVEAGRKAAALIEVETSAAKEKAMTVNIACGRYWMEVGRFAKNGAAVEWSIKYLAAQLGYDKRLADITNADIAQLVSRRRGERVDNHLARKSRPEASFKLVSNATVNRSVLDPLRRIMLRASDKWGVDVGRIAWAEHRLKEPKERVRFLSADEESRLFAALPAAYHPIVRFALQTGCRAMECVDLKWADIDRGERRAAIRGKGSSAGPKMRMIPLPKDLCELLFSSQDNPSVHVFTMPAPTRKDGFREPDRRITYRGLYSAVRRACRAADVAGLRIHDFRHTAATRIVRKTGNLKLAMKLLGHEDISTTSKYAAVLDEDLRQAMDALEAETLR